MSNTVFNATDYAAELLAVKSSDEALAKFADFVDACYSLNSIRVRWRGRFDHLLNKDLVERTFCDFMFTNKIHDVVKPLQYFKAWRFLTEVNYFSLNAVGALNDHSRNVAESKLRKILDIACTD
jgi:hypothetical protein